MKRWIPIVLATGLAVTALAQNVVSGKEGMVTVTSRGNDVRTVVHDLFAQLGKNYILDPAVRLQPLYLSLKDVEFEEALFQICKLAELRFEVQNGIFYVNRSPKAAPPKSEPKTAEQKIVPKAEPTGTLPATVWGKKVTTRFEKVDLREAMADLGKQTGLKIEVDAKVPRYKIDAYLINTSLKYALDQISTAANLRYRLTNRMTIEIVPMVAAAVEPEAGKPGGNAGH